MGFGGVILKIRTQNPEVRVDPKWVPGRERLDYVYISFSWNSKIFIN